MGELKHFIFLNPPHKMSLQFYRYHKKGVLRKHKIRFANVRHSHTHTHNMNCSSNWGYQKFSRNCQMAEIAYSIFNCMYASPFSLLTKKSCFGK